MTQPAAPFEEEIAKIAPESLSSAPEVFSVTPEEIGLRLDHLLVRHFPTHSRSYLQRCIQANLVRVNGDASTRPGLRLEGDETIEIRGWLDETPEEIVAADIPLDVLYEDDAILVINKPAGLVVHPAPGNRQGTLVSALLNYAPETFAELADDEEVRPGIVHRLDKDTSGVMVIAKAPDAYEKLKDDFRSHRIDKIYLAIARGPFRDGFGTIDAPIGRDEKNRLKRKVCDDGSGKVALTKYRRVGEAHGCTLLQVRLYTGRTHQIRVHLAHIGHPVLGDLLYSGGAQCPPFRYRRQLLHAWKLALQHPRTGERLVFTAPMPPDFASEADRFAPFCDLSVLSS